MEQAVKHCTQGIGIWQWASNDQGCEPDVVMALSLIHILVSPFTAASAAPWIPPPCRSSSISRWASPDLARRLRASLFLTRSAGRLSCPFLPLLS